MPVLKIIICLLFCLLPIGYLVSVKPAYAEGMTREVLWKCAASKECPKGLTSNRARSGLDEYDQKGLDDLKKKREALQRSGVVDCAYGGDCTEGLTPERAREIVEDAERGPSSKETLASVKRCYIYGECLGDDVSGDLKRKLPNFEQRRLEAEKTAEIKRNKRDFAWKAEKCAAGGECKWPLTQQKAKDFDKLGGLEQSLLRCAAGYGCPEGINEKQAIALTSADVLREFEARQEKKAKAVEPKESSSNADDQKEIKPEAELSQELPNELPNAESQAETEDLTFDDPELDRLFSHKFETKERSSVSPIVAANPNIGVVAHVIAAAGPQQIPNYFSPQELLSARLPWLDGDDEPDETLAQQDPSLEKPGPPKPVVGETIETLANPNLAPPVFVIERKNEHRDRSDLEKVAATLSGSIVNNGSVPRISLTASIASEQISTERLGAKSVTGGAPRGEIDAMAFVPIDDGGAPIDVSLAIGAKLQGRSIRAGVVPYSEDVFANVALVGQTRIVLSADNADQALSSAQLTFGMAGFEKPEIGTWGDFVTFNFPQTDLGKPRGFLVFISAEADPEIVSQKDLIRGLDKVTVIQTKGMQTGKINVLVVSATPANR